MYPRPPPFHCSFLHRCIALVIIPKQIQIQLYETWHISIINQTSGRIVTRGLTPFLIFDHRQFSSTVSSLSPFAPHMGTLINKNLSIPLLPMGSLNHTNPGHRKKLSPQTPSHYTTFALVIMNQMASALLFQEFLLRVINSLPNSFGMCGIISLNIQPTINVRESILSLWGDCSGIKIEIPYRRISGKSPNTWNINIHLSIIDV